MTADPHRLPRTVIPLHYDLRVAPDIASGRFSGDVTITVEVLRSVEEFVLNAVGLEVTRAELRLPDGRVLPAEATARPLEQLALRFGEPVAPGPDLALTLSFAGTFNDEECGYYLAGYDADGQRQQVATSFFAPVDARRAFPCWDEPDLKARFTITVEAPDDLTVVSNNVVKSVEPAGPGQQRVRFATTVPISTYLVSYLAGHLEATEPVEVNGTAVSVVVPRGRRHLTDFAVQHAVDSLRLLTRYFEMDFPQAKLDHVGIPGFVGGTENFGCVLYAADRLVIDTDRASLAQLRSAAGTIAHETAHMWFGDLVTMRWWDSVWLNEAFATLMDHTVNAELHPEWEVWAALTVDRAEAMAIDGLRATRPVQAQARTRQDIEAMLDVLTYQKGSSVLRMLADFLGAETFRRGIVLYLREHCYGNTDAADLWAALEEVSGKPVARIMTSWLEQGGHPVISAVPGPTPDTVTISQRRVRHTGGDAGPQRWLVPVRLKASHAGTVEQHNVLLEGGSTVVRLAGPPQWLLLNAEASGFYRTHCPPALNSGLRDAFGGFTAAERVALLDDVWAAVVRAETGLGEYLELLTALEGEESAEVWLTAGGALLELERAVADADLPALRAFVRRVAGPTLERLGWDAAPGEPVGRAAARAQLVRLLGTVGGDPLVAAEAERRLVTGTAELPADLTASGLRAAVAQGGRPAWDRVRTMFDATTDPAVRVRLLDALTATDDPDCLAALLDLSLTGAVAPPGTTAVVNAVLATRTGASPGFAWVRANWSAVRGKVHKYMLPRTLRPIGWFADPALADTARAWLATGQVPLGDARIVQLTERLDATVTVAARLRAAAAEAFAARA